MCYLATLYTLVQSLVSGVDPPLVLDQGVVGLEPLAAVSAGEGQLVVSLLAVAHDVFRAYFSNSTVGTEVDPVLEIFLFSKFLINISALLLPEDCH